MADVVHLPINQQTEYYHPSRNTHTHSQQGSDVGPLPRRHAFRILELLSVTRGQRMRESGIPPSSLQNQKVDDAVKMLSRMMAHQMRSL
jgi:hypothetical protein